MKLDPANGSKFENNPQEINLLVLGTLGMELRSSFEN